MPTLAEVFHEHMGELEFDRQMASRVYRFQVDYINRDPNRINFFASNMIGVYPLRFTDADVARFYNEVLEVDYFALKDALAEVEYISKEWKVSGDAFNQTLMYCIHRFLTSPSMRPTDREKAGYYVALVFFYRCMAALMSDWFRTYQADPEICQAAYERLSNRFLIKQLGSWDKVMDYRAKSFLDPDGGRAEEDKGTYHKLQRFNSDREIVDAINAGQGSIRSQIREYYAVLVETSNARDSVVSTSSTYVDSEGKETTREKTKGPEIYTAYLRQVLIEPRVLIKDDLVSVIANINTNTSARMIRQSLQWLSDNYTDGKHHRDIDAFIEAVVVYSCHLINTQITPDNANNYSRLLIELKNLYLASRSNDRDLLHIRKLGEKLIKKTSKHRLGTSLIMATRTSVILYLTMRFIVGDKA